MLYQIIKRIFDAACAAVALVLSLPFWLIAAAGIKLSSPGPVFYRSRRLGKNGREFSVYKFRSMHLYQPEDPASGKKSEGGFIANEKRMFAFGKLLRKSKLDELPQLLSILAGTMSIVGPRPYPEKSVRKIYTGKYEKVLSVKPGLTGPDSLYDYAHGELFVKETQTYLEKVLPVRTELAMMYTERQGIALDLACIFRTVSLIFRIMVLKQKTFALTKLEAEAAKRAFQN